MRMDLIDRESLVKWLKDAGWYLRTLESAKSERKMLGKIIDHVVAMPTVEAVPVRHGKWIPVEGSDFRDNSIIGFKCSECGRVEYKQQPYCNCGAKMG